MFFLVLISCSSSALYDMLLVLRTSSSGKCRRWISIQALHLQLSSQILGSHLCRFTSPNFRSCRCLSTLIRQPVGRNGGNPVQPPVKDKFGICLDVPVSDHYIQRELNIWFVCR